MKKVYGAWRGNPKGTPGDPKRCSESVYDSVSRLSHQCRNKGTINEKGELWCKAHAPSTKAEKLAKRESAYQASVAAEQAKYAKRDADAAKLALFDEAGAMLVYIADELDRADTDEDCGIAANAIEPKLRALLAKIKG